jgi:hypothetical protein
MNRILIGLLQTILRTLVGALNYERLTLLVEDAEKTDMTGEMKRAMVLEEARTIGLAIGQALLNLAKVLAELGSAVAGIQQLMKGAQTTLPETGR